MKNRTVEMVTMGEGEETREEPVIVKGRRIGGDYSTTYGPGAITRSFRPHASRVEQGFK